jgi:1-acyl-sn-glycerol-3-phosphate acyltransferase
MRRWWWKCCQWSVRLTGTVLWQFRAFGVRNIPREGGVLLACNHQSYLDPALVGSCLLREMHFMARSSLFRNPVFGAMITALNAFPVERDSADVRAVKGAIDRLKAGCVVLVFPEGTRTRTGAVGRMKSGAALLAERAGVPIIPVLIEGAFQVWPKGERRWPGLGRVRVVFGKPMPPAGDPGVDPGERVRSAVLRLKGELPGCRIESS